MFKIGPKMTKINPKRLKIRQIDPKISKKCVCYDKIPTQGKKCGTSPTAGTQTYWAAPAQLPTQFAPLILKIFTFPRTVAMPRMVTIRWI